MFWLENVKETLFTGVVSKLQNMFAHGEDVHPHLIYPKGQKYHHTFEENNVYKCLFTC